MKRLFSGWMLLLFFIMTLYSLFCLAFPAPAIADGTPLAVAASGVMTGFIFPLLTALLIGLVAWAVVKIGTKYKLDVVLNNEKLIESFALKGITYAEEYAANKLKQSNIKVTSDDKMNLAIAQVLQSAPKLTADQAGEYVQSILARITGAGATGASAVTVPTAQNATTAPAQDSAAPAEPAKS